MHPVVAVGVVEVPMGVDEDLDGVAVDGCEGGSELRLAGRIAGVDEQLAFFGGEDRDVAAGSAEEGDVPAEGRRGDLVVGVGGASLDEEVLRLLRKEASWTRGTAVAAALMARKRRREIAWSDLVMRIVLCTSKIHA
jgi:hypothetical protein